LDFSEFGIGESDVEFGEFGHGSEVAGGGIEVAGVGDLNTRLRGLIA
jgi:hypothetical protein